jgi:hypothetical protein
VATFRVFVFQLSPGAEAIVATLHLGLGDADEERPREREVILRAPAVDTRSAVEHLVALLGRYHPCWPELIELSYDVGGIWTRARPRVRPRPPASTAPRTR